MSYIQNMTSICGLCCAAAEWDAQDEARRLTQQHEAARRARVAVAAEKAAAQEAAQAIMLANELEAQEKLLKVGCAC